MAENQEGRTGDPEAMISVNSDRPTRGKVRVAYLTSQFPVPSATFILNELVGLRDRGIEIDMFSIRRPSNDAFAATLAREMISVTYLLPVSVVGLIRAHAWACLRSPLRYLSTLGFAATRRRTGLRRRFYMAFYFAEAVLLAKELVSRSLDHIHVHHANNAVLVAMLAARYLEIPYSFTAHGSDILVEKDLLEDKVGNADFMVTVSDYNRNVLCRYCDASRQKRIEVVRTGVDVRRFTPAPAQVGSTVRILSVGRLVAVKAFEDLIRACAVLRERGLEFRCVIVGDGPLRAELEALRCELDLEAQVAFAGTIPHERLPECYARSDLFVLASVSEGIPVVLMEAMACGLPVVATRIVGIPELVEEGVTGYLVQPGHPDRLASAILRLVELPDRGKGMGERGRARVIRSFDVGPNLEHLSQVFLHYIRQIR